MSIALQAREGMTQAALTVPDKLRAEIEKPEWQGWWLAAFQARLQRAERDAVRLYPELLKMVGANEAALELALRALGVSLDVAQRAVGMYRSVEGVDPAGVVEMAQKVIEGHGGRVLWPASGPSLAQGAIGPSGEGGAPESSTNGNGGPLGGLASEST